MAVARAQALAQLEASKQNAEEPIHQTGQTGGLKGPRRTYETSTSGPSFGHIMHQDGQPLRMSGPVMPPGFPQSAPMARDIGGPPPFIRIPFGVPLGASIPRPLFVMRNSVGVGMGVGLGGGVGGMQDMAKMPGPPAGQQYISAPSPEQKRKDDRSAYVETIEDVSRHKKMAKGRNQLIAAGTGSDSHHADSHRKSAIGSTCLTCQRTRC